jgi:hypothetical protein
MRASASTGALGGSELLEEPSSTGGPAWVGSLVPAGELASGTGLAVVPESAPVGGTAPEADFGRSTAPSSEERGSSAVEGVSGAGRGAGASLGGFGPPVTVSEEAEEEGRAATAGGDAMGVEGGTSTDGSVGSTSDEGASRTSTWSSSPTSSTAVGAVAAASVAVPDVPWALELSGGTGSGCPPATSVVSTEADASCTD